MNEPTYECDQCGACCRSKLVDLYEVDLLREPKLRPVMRDVTDDFADEIGYLNCLVERGCPMLGDDNRCTIHPTRPTVCVAFPAGDEECQEAREVAGLPPLQPINGPSLVEGQAGQREGRLF